MKNSNKEEHRDDDGDEEEESERKNSIFMSAPRFIVQEIIMPRTGIPRLVGLKEAWDVSNVASR